jgi:hypothetical protein
VTTDQLSLFSEAPHPPQPPPTCPHDRPTTLEHYWSLIQASPLTCVVCNHAAIAHELRAKPPTAGPSVTASIRGSTSATPHQPRPTAPASTPSSTSRASHRPAHHGPSWSPGPPASSPVNKRPGGNPSRTAPGPDQGGTLGQEASSPTRPAGPDHHRQRPTVLPQGPARAGPPRPRPPRTRQRNRGRRGGRVGGWPVEPVVRRPTPPHAAHGRPHGPPPCGCPEALHATVARELARRQPPPEPPPIPPDQAVSPGVWLLWAAGLLVVVGPASWRPPILTAAAVAVGLAAVGHPRRPTRPTRRHQTRGSGRRQGRRRR